MVQFSHTRSVSTCCAAVALIGLLATAAASAQDAAAAAGSDAPSAGTSASVAAVEAKAEFHRKLQALKEPMKQMEWMRIEYQKADEARRGELQQELQKQFQSAKAILPEVVGAALVAFEAAGGKDQEIEDFLMSVVDQYVAADHYEEAMPVIASLTEAGVEHPAVSIWGALAGFAVADYDAAKRHFARLEELGVLSQPPRTNNQHELELLRLVTSFQGILAEHEEAWQREQQLRAAEAEADDLPRVLLKTSRGDITLELFENEAPNTVKNFVTLVEQGAYDGTAFHRVLPNFMAQGGDPTTGGKPEPAYTIPCECYEPDARKHFRGSLSMAHRGRNTANAGFFLTFLPTPHLDGKTFNPASSNDAHTVFGRVIEGLDVLAEIQRVNVHPAEVRTAEPPPDRILQAKVLRKRPDTDYGSFRKLAP